MRVDEMYLGQTTHNHFTGFLGVIDKRNGTQFVKFNSCIVLSYDACIGCCITGYTTSVEGSQRQLRARLTNSLCGNDTGSFTQLHHACGS